MSSVTSSRAAAAVSRSSTSRMRSASRGTSEAKSMASSTSTGFGTRDLPWRPQRRHVGLGLGGLGLPLDDDLAEQPGLLRADLALPAQLGDRQQADHHHRALALATRHG